MRVHRKHGLNPTILKCPVCGQDRGIALLGAYCKGPAPLCMSDSGPCEDCQEKFDTYLQRDSCHFIILIVSDLYEPLRLEKNPPPMWPYLKAAYFTTLQEVKKVFKDCVDLSSRRCALGETAAISIGLDLKTMTRR